MGRGIGRMRLRRWPRISPAFVRFVRRRIPLALIRFVIGRPTVRLGGAASESVFIISWGRVSAFRVARTRRSEWPESLVGTAPVSCRRRRSARFPGRHCRCMILAASGSGRDGRMAAEICRPGSRRYSRTPVILRSEVLPVLSRRVFMLHLRRQRGLVGLAGVPFFFCSGSRLDAASPVKCNVILVHNDRPVIDAGYIGDADIRDGPVIEELVSAPLATGKSDAGISEPIVNTAVEPNVRPPISGVPDIQSAAPAPISGRPQHSDRRHYPRSRHPVVAAVIVPSPITGRPHISRPRADGLCIHRQSGWTNPYRNSDCDLPKGCNGK